MCPRGRVRCVTRRVCTAHLPPLIRAAGLGPAGKGVGVARPLGGQWDTKREAEEEEEEEAAPPPPCFSAARAWALATMADISPTVFESLMRVGVGRRCTRRAANPRA